MPLSPGSAKDELDVLQRVRAGGLVAELHVLRAVLEVEELVADAAVALDVDAGAEHARRWPCRRR